MTDRLEPSRLLSPALILKGIGWITAMFVVANIVRFGSNIYLTRILTPELMGAVLVIMTMRNSVELMGDVGIGQNIVTSKRGGDPQFQSTAEIIQILRGCILGFLMYVMASRIAEIYQLPLSAIELAALSLVVLGLSSVSIHVLQRQLGFARISIFDVSNEIVGALFAVIAATISQSIMSLVLANLAATLVRTVASHWVGPAPARFGFSRPDAMEILAFGKWIFLFSLLMLLCMNFDRLFLGQAVPLALVGIYGIARTLCEIPAALALRLSHSLVFPVIASGAAKPRHELRAALGGVRWRLLASGALLMGCGIAIADLVVLLVYDSRYHEAGAMLPLLLLGSWFSILAHINEYALMGLGSPKYAVAGNVVKAAYLIVMLPLALALGGIMLAIAALALAELPRMVPIALGLKQQQFGFFRQDGLSTAIVGCTAVALIVLRYVAGYGTPFDGLLR